MTWMCGAGDGVAEAVVAVLAGDGGHQALQFDDVALAAEFFGDPFAGGAANFLVVSADEAGVFVAEDGAVQDDDGNAGVHGAGDGFGQGLGFFRADEDEIDLGADQFLDVGALFEGVILRVFEDDFQFGMLGGGVADVLVHLHAPRLAQVALGHADDELAGDRAGFGLAATSEEQRQRDSGEDEKTSVHGKSMA